jgi:hypothetical protein
MAELRLSSHDLNPLPPTLSRMDGGRAAFYGYNVGQYPDSVAAISQQTAEVEFYPEGSFIKAKRSPLHKVRSAAKPPLNKRGVVAGFSRQSRDRLLQKLAKLKRSELPLFVTLTYPGAYPVHPEEWKRNMDNFAKRFARRFPHAGFVWKLEPQKRGAPHFHLLAWDAELTTIEFGVALRAWIKQAWYEVVGSGDERHLRAGTGVEVVRSFQGVIYYASKYMSKPVEVDDAWGNPGRWWGVVGRSNIPYADQLSTWLETGDVNSLMRWITRFRRLKGQDCMSRWAIVESPGTWVDNVQRNQEIRNSADLLAAKTFA